MNSDAKLENIVEAILFWKGEPLSVKELVKIIKSDEESIKKALGTLEENLKTRGVVLMTKSSGRESKENKETEYSLGTYPEASARIEAITKEELSKDLGKASLETLSIILYKGPVKRSEIDYVRGVNSNFILRNLLIRGLIEKKQSPDDARASVYQASFELLSFLGITDVAKLPNFELVQEELRQFRASVEGGEKEQSENASPEAGTIAEGDPEFLNKNQQHED